MGEPEFRAYAALVRIHGTATGQTCGDCRFYTTTNVAKPTGWTQRPMRTYASCEKAGKLRFWKAYWVACGKFEAKPAT